MLLVRNVCGGRQCGCPIDIAIHPASFPHPGACLFARCSLAAGPRSELDPATAQPSLLLLRELVEQAAADASQRYGFLWDLAVASCLFCFHVPPDVPHGHALWYWGLTAALSIPFMFKLGA